MGLSYDLRYADNNAPVHRFEEEEWIPDPKMSTWFIRPHSRRGAYTQWADAYGKFSYQAACDCNGIASLTECRKYGLRTS